MATSCMEFVQELSRSTGGSRIDGATVARGAINGPLVRINIKILQRSELIIDAAVQDLHFARGLLRALLITREIRHHVTMRARHAKGLAIPAVS